MNDTEQESKPAISVKNDEDTDEESDVLEESPCGRWQKRREEVEQRDVPGIDNAFLAMDTEEGMEVVWNEVYLSEKKDRRAQMEKIRMVFDNIIRLDHPNIVKFHKYWTDTSSDKPRVIFITEYMSSGSLKQFLKKTKKNNKTFQLKAWKRWCTQILSALSYLHLCDPPVIHGNLTCDTIFIQHNGLIKIGSVAPDAMHQVKTCRNDLKNRHYVAPEYGSATVLSSAVDIYSFGMCALEMAALGIQGNGDSGTLVTEEAINKTLQSIENPLQRDFIEKCLEKTQRRDLHQEICYSILCCLRSIPLHSLLHMPLLKMLVETIAEDTHILKVDPKKVIGEMNCKNLPEPHVVRVSQVPVLELEKFLEDVKNGIYPLTAFDLPQPPKKHPRTKTPEMAKQIKSATPEPVDVETRRVTHMSCQIRWQQDSKMHHLTLLLRMDDKMNRQLECEISEDDNAAILAEELVRNGFINEKDKDLISKFLASELQDASLVNGVLEENTQVPVSVSS